MTVSLVKQLPRHAQPVDHGLALDVPSVIINIDRENGSRFPFVVNHPLPPLLAWPSPADMALLATMDCKGCGCPWSVHCDNHCHRLALQAEEWLGLGRLYGIAQCTCAGMVA